MDKKYTSLESTIRNVVRGNTGAAQDNRSLESKIRSVVLKEEVALDEGSAKFAKIMARTAAARGEPITTDTTELEKKHNELLQNSRDAAARAKKAREDYEDLARQYGITPTPIGEEFELTEAPGDAAPPGENHLGVHELFGYLRDYNEDHDRSTDPEDPDEYGAKESRADINSTEKMIRKIHGQDTLDHVRNAIEAERHIRLGTNPGVNNHQAVKDHLDAAVKASRHFSEALGTGGNEGGEFKGTPPAFFKPFHVEPKVGDAHPPSEGAAAASRNRAKIASSETMKKESYIITPRGRASIHNESVENLDEISAGEAADTAADILVPYYSAGKRGYSAWNKVKSGDYLGAAKDAAIGTGEAGLDTALLALSLPSFGAAWAGRTAVKTGLKVGEKVLEKGAVGALEKGAVGSAERAATRTSPRGAPEPAKPAEPAKGKTGKNPNERKRAEAESRLDAIDAMTSGVGGSVGSPMPMPTLKVSSQPSAMGSKSSINVHRAGARKVYGQEIHYNEYSPAGNYIGEDADSERSAIQNVARPNSKNKLTKQAEIKTKILEDTARRKSVILRAKEENKNGKDGGNSDVETKPELKRVDVNEQEVTASNIAGTLAKGMAKRVIADRVPGAGAAMEIIDKNSELNTKINKGDIAGAVIRGAETVANRVPGVGAAMEIGDKNSPLNTRINKGDIVGAAIRGAETVANQVPGGGTLVGAGLGAVNTARDFIKNNPSRVSAYGTSGMQKSDAKSWDDNNPQRNAKIGTPSQFPSK